MLRTEADAERVMVLSQLERQAGILIRRSRRSIAERAAIVHPELPPAAYIMLSFLNTNGPSRASEIADTFLLDKGTVSRNVQALLELGLITKCQDPEDGRAVILTITEEAAGQARDMQRERLRRLDERLGEWSIEEITHFVDVFSRYNDLLE